MVKLEYFNGKEWVFLKEWPNVEIAWCTLGGDTFNYRVVDKTGNVLKEDTQFIKDEKPKPATPIKI